MKTYIYYNKYDSSKEPQGKVQADNITEAIKKSAVVKQMDLDSFLTIFNVKTYGKAKV